MENQNQQAVQFTPEELDELRYLKAEYEQLDNNLSEAKIRKQKKVIQLVQGAMRQTEAKIAAYGLKPEDLYELEYKQPDASFDYMHEAAIEQEKLHPGTVDFNALENGKSEEDEALFKPMEDTYNNDNNDYIDETTGSVNMDTDYDMENVKQGNPFTSEDATTTSADDNDDSYKELFNLTKEEPQEEDDIVVEGNPITVRPNTTFTTETNMDLDVAYDVLPLPSNGECYKSKISKVQVSYLTASDENIITSPNLYADGSVIDVLLKRKVMTKGLNIDELCKGDRDMIILWLRATGYGNEFPITVRDPETKKTFDTTIDLSEIKIKPFNLKADSEGLFEYITPIRKHNIKFRFFTRKDEKKLLEMDKGDALAVEKNTLQRLIDEFKATMIESNALSQPERTKLINSLKVFEMWKNKLPNRRSDTTNSITNAMELSIVEVNGERDRKFIRKYIQTMPALESLRFRQYLSDNEPGMNFKIKVTRPESLGGGSFDTFLTIDYTLFLNLPRV